MLNEPERMDLETLVDAHGLCAVIAALSDLCHEKSAHVSAVWQDRALARHWMRLANAVERAQTAASKIGDLP